MADQKISQLSDGGASQATDEYVIARSGANYRIDGASIAAAATSVGTLSSLTVSGDLTVDTSTLKVDSANNLVGIGIAPSSGQGRLQIDRALGTSADSAIRITDNATTSFYLNNTASGVSSLWSSGAIGFGTGNGIYAEKMRIDASGNLGLGVTPSAWDTYTALQIKNGSIANYSPTQDMRISSNAYYTSGVWKRIAAAYAVQYLQDGSTGTHAWFNAGTSTADSTITFTQAMTLDASGNLQIGRTTSSGSPYKLELNSASDTRFALSVGGTLTAGIDAGSGIATVVAYGASTPLAFQTNNAERARITSDGNFLIGDTSGTHKLTVSVPSGADREMVICGVTGASNGFRVQWNHATLKTRVSITDIPTSSAGLPAGTLYSDGGTIKIA